jgi:hypothetical protein
MNSNQGEWFWLSFCDSDLPEGSQFLGVSLVGPCLNIAHAAMIAHGKGCNPGGEVIGHVVPSPYIDVVPDEYRFTLLTKQQARDVDTILESVNRRDEGRVS